MKLSIVESPTARVVTDVNNGKLITGSFPIFVIETETAEETAETADLFAKLFETYSKEE